MHPSFSHVPLLPLLCHFCSTVGLDQTVKDYTDELQRKASTATGGVAIPFHGMGGIGKSTLAIQLFNRLAASGHFSGGKYSTEIKRHFRNDGGGNLPVEQAQQKLLGQVLGSQPPANNTLEEGCTLLGQALQRKQGPVLLKVDNVPEGGRGIFGMLLDNLLDILPKRWGKTALVRLVSAYSCAYLPPCWCSMFPHAQRQPAAVHSSDHE